MKILLLALGCLMAAPAVAQVSGSINRNAPKVEHSITMGDHKVKMSYTAIAYGEGEWQKIKDNADAHERFNRGAENRPIGSVSSSVDVAVAGKTVPAGEYKMFFTVHPEAGWILNAKNDENHVMWRMAMKETDTHHKRMQIHLTPADEADHCNLTFAFGNKMVQVPVAPAKKDDQ